MTNKVNKPYYVVIPAKVRYDDRLTPNSKILYGDISALCNSTGVCWASNSYLAEITGVDKLTVSRWVSQLEDCGHIKSRLKIGANGEVEGRHIKISVPTAFFVKVGTDKIVKDKKENNKKSEENNTVYTTMQSASAEVQKQQVPVLEEPVTKPNWENTSNDLQRFMCFYVKNWNETLYKDGSKEQVSAFFRTYGKMFSQMLGVAGSLEIACNTVVYFDRHFKKEGWSWNLKTLTTNFPEFVNYAMQKKGEENNEKGITG